MQKKKLLLFISLEILICMTPLAAQQQNGTVSTAAEPKLVIYTYESLLADPGFDFVDAYATHAGIAKDSIQLVLLDDAGAIVSRAATEKANPKADVLIGIDNILVHKAREQEILTPYTPLGIDNLRDALVDELASDHLLTPYDYGVIGVWYDKTRFSGFNQTDFTFDKLLQYQQSFILENPQLSSPGLGFLLWTLAMLGHEDISGDSSTWEAFWSNLREQTELTSSWNDALTLFYTPEAERSMMVSYTSSPAYGLCLYNDSTTGVAISHTENGTATGWYQIEGLGLVNNAPHSEEGKDFIDWFITSDVQNEIYLNQWMYPALKNVQTPTCYTESTLSPDQIEPLNTKISQDKISTQLDSWLDQWEIIWTTPSNKNGFLPLNIFTVLSAVIIAVFVKKSHKKAF